MENETLLVDASKVTNENGARLDWRAWTLSADSEYVLFQSDYVKQWRHSSFGNYYVHRLSDSTTFPITPPSSPPKVTLVKWSPTGHSLAFVMENDMYVIPGQGMSGSQPDAIRITNDGSETVFNGVPDWVYEEEVFSSNSALWWSPNSDTIAYLRSDETQVLDYKLQYYNPSTDAFTVQPYPTELDMK
jgi:dipeptidyl aminopeptidase